MSRLSKFYGWNCFGLPTCELLALEAAMPGLQAEEDLRERGDSMPLDDFYDAVLAATGSEAKAQEWTAQRAAARLRAGEEVD